MPKVGKQKLAKATIRKTRIATTASPKAVGVSAKKRPLKVASPLKAVSESAVPSVSGKVVTPGAKKVSQKLIETIEKRKANGKMSPMFSRPPGRRGRRPKNSAEYTPEHQEEETFSPDADQETLEYDTGIRVTQPRDESGFNLERFEEFDEELNFDW